MDRINKTETATSLAAALLILLFLYAAIMKLGDYANFVSQLQHSPLLEHYAKPISWFILVLEIGICILLMFPIYRKTGFRLAFLLMLMFTIYIIYVLRFAPYIPCACGGVLSHMGWKTHLIFNIIYTGLAFTAILLQQQLERPALRMPV